MSKKEIFLIAGLLGGFVLLNRYAMPHGYHWGGDYAMYLAHALNIIEHKPYDELNYVFNPHAVIFPRTYPPLYPVVLSLLLPRTGVDVEAVARAHIYLTAGALVFVYLYYRRTWNRPLSLLLWAAVAFEPFIRTLSFQILSEPLFLLWLYLFLWWFQRRPVPEKGPGWNRSLVMGGLMALLVLTRTIGWVIVAAVVGWALVTRRFRELRRPLIVFAMVIGFSALIWPVPRGYSAYVLAHWRLIGDNITAIVLQTPVFYLPVPPPWNGVLAWMVWGLIIMGWVHQWRRRAFLSDIVLLFYLGTIALWPTENEQIRLILPVLPLLIEAFASGVAVVIRRIPLTYGLRRIVFYLIVVPALASDLSKCAVRYERYPHSILAPSAQTMFAHIREVVPQNGIIITSKPRVVTLFTNKRAGIYHKPHEDTDLIRYFCRNDVTHVLSRGFFYDDMNFLIPFLQRHPDVFKPVYASGPLMLWRFERSSVCEPGLPSLTSPSEG